MQWNNSKLSDCHAEMEHTSPQTYRRTIDTLPQMRTHRRATLILQKERCLKNIINTGQRWCWCSSSRYTCHHQTRQLPCCWNPILYPDCFLDVGKRAQPQCLDVDTWPAKFEFYERVTLTPQNIATHLWMLLGSLINTVEIGNHIAWEIAHDFGSDYISHRNSLLQRQLR